MKKKALSFVLAMMLMSSVLSGCGGTGKTDTSAVDKNESVSDTSTASDVSKESTASDAEDSSEPAESENEDSKADKSFAGGSGTAEDPWQVATAEQLDSIRNDLTAHYILTDDIDLSVYKNCLDVEKLAIRIFLNDKIQEMNESVLLKFRIAQKMARTLYHVAGEPMATGLFGCTSGTENGTSYIRNFTLKNVNVSGFYLVGGAVGLQFMNCPVSDIHLVGNNRLSGSQGIGGIVGTGFDLISDCSATADITVQGDNGACAGLIAGGTTMSSIKNCEVTDGSITAEGNNITLNLSDYTMTFTRQ